MKRQVKAAALLLALCALLSLTSCKKTENLSDISRPEGFATGDEAQIQEMTGAAEKSENVNGMRFTFDLLGFSQSYNNSKKELGQNDLIFYGNWRKQGETEKDDNGTEIDYYYYDDINVNFTATVEAHTGKLLNIGCGTTMSTFMGQTGDKNNSDLILAKAALMAQTVCQFPKESRSVIQDIFFRTATESNDTLWYKGFVFNLSTREDKNDRKNNVMLFRVFPISEELRKEWKLQEYIF